MLLGSIVFVVLGAVVVLVLAFGTALLDAARSKKINSDVEDWAAVLSETFWGDPEEAWDYMLTQYPIEERFRASAKIAFMKVYW